MPSLPHLLTVSLSFRMKILLALIAHSLHRSLSCVQYLFNRQCSCTYLKWRTFCSREVKAENAAKLDNTAIE